MKSQNNLKFLSLMAGMIFFIHLATAQKSRFTPYDELPSVEKILKPEYSDDMPAWGKMLYDYPVNFNTINKEFVKWETQNKGVKSSLIRYYKLWRLHLEPYVTYDGTIELPDLQKLNEDLKKSQTMTSQMQKAPAVGNSSNWTFLGPKQTFWLNESGSTTEPKACPWQVNVYSMDVTEANPNVLYAGTETGFVNKSVDKGLNWTLCGQNYNFGGSVTAVCIHPTNPDVVFVSAGNTIHKSLDGGLTWTRSNASFYANRIKIDPTNNSKLVASTNYGVYVSTDMGVNWNRKNTSEAWDVEIKPGSADTMYAITRSSDNYFRIIQSTNGGTSFTDIASFPRTIPNVEGGLLAVTAKNPNVLWVVMLSKNAANANTPYVYKGTFSAGAWTWQLKATGNTTALGMTNGQGFFDLALEVSPTNENIIYVATTSLYRSSDGGTNFYAIGGYIGNYSIHPDIQDMRMLSNGDTWVSTDGGINLTTNNFTSATKHYALNNGLIGSAMWGFDQGWNEDIIVGGRYHNGNTAISDMYGNKALRMGGAESPTGWILQGKSRHAAFDDLGDGWILPKTAEGKPEGRFIFSKYPNMDQYGALRSNVITHPHYSGTLYVGSANSIWKSSNFGTSYDLLYTFPGRIRYVNISLSNPNVLYADIDGSTNGFYKSTDGGATWTKKNNATTWNGQIAFAISPYNENVVYAAKQNGAWDTFNSEMYKTTDGGATWTQWSVLGRSIKTISIQPTKEGKDLVYISTNAQSGKQAKVFIKMDGDANWTEFATNYPAGMNAIAAAPFFRDSKLRIAGNAGVWETPLAQTDYTPIITPWVSQSVYYCTLDTVQFDDHSMIDHQGVSWNWEITPAPTYISNPNIRNPKALFEKGKYTVTLKVTKNDSVYSKTIVDMFEVKSCPTVDDCSNPGEVPQNIWKLVYADSYQTGNEPTKAFDGNTSTIWHTQYSPTAPVHPHQIQIDLGKSYNLSQLIYYPRTDGANGRIKKYEIYVSDDKNNWGTPVKADSLTNTSGPSTLKFAEKVGRYVKLVALSEVNGNAWTTAAEIKLIGCNITTGNNEIIEQMDVKAFPVPAKDIIRINLPFNDGISAYDYTVYSMNGQTMSSGQTQAGDHDLHLSLQQFQEGSYIVVLTNKNGNQFRVKVIKN